MSTNVQTADRKGGLGFVIWISMIATLGGFLFGYDSGVINGTVDGLEKAFNAKDFATGFNVASMLLGCAFGAFFAGRLADMYGRKSLLLVASVFFIISAWGSGIAHGSGEFIIYRILGGIGVGAASVMAPAYISEIAPAHLRGRLTTIQQVAILLGLFFAFLSNYLLAKTAGKSTEILWNGYEAWRCMFWMELAPAVVFFIALFGIPESPRYLVLKGKTEKAEGVLTRLFDATTAKQKVSEIKASLDADHKPRLSDLIDPALKKIRPIVWVGIGLAIFQQLVGINVIFYYGAVLWQAAGFSEGDALLINIIGSALSLGSVVVALMVIDKIGRKPMLLIGSIGMALALGLAGFAFSTGVLFPAGAVIEAGTTLANGTVYETQAVMGGALLDLTPGMGLMGVIAANVFVMFFNFSWGPVMWVMLGEMFPNQIRGSGLAVAGLAQWLANFVIIMSFPVLLSTIGLASAYGIYTFFAVLSIFFVIKMVHETKGVELEDMQG